eukprot:g21363.t1
MRKVRRLPLAQQSWQDAVAFLELQGRRKQLPSLATYTSVMSACTRQSQWQLSITVIDRLRGQQLRPDLVAQNAELWAFAKGLQWPLVLQGLQRLSTAACSSSFGALIDLFAKGSQWQRALNLFQTQKGLQEDLVTFNLLLNACESRLKLQGSCRSLSESLNTTLSSLAAVAQWRRALHLWATRRGASDERIQPTVITMNSLMIACSAAFHWEQAIHLWQGLTPYVGTSEATYGVLMETLGAPAAGTTAKGGGRPKGCVTAVSALKEVVESVNGLCVPSVIAWRILHCPRSWSDDYVISLVCLVLWILALKQPKPTDAAFMVLVASTGLGFGFGGMAHMRLFIVERAGAVCGSAFSEVHSEWMYPWLLAMLISAFSPAALAAMAIHAPGSCANWLAAPMTLGLLLISLGLAVFEGFSVWNGNLTGSGNYIGYWTLAASSLALVTFLCDACRGVGGTGVGGKGWSGVASAACYIAGILTLQFLSGSLPDDAGRNGLVAYAPYPAAAEAFNQNAVFHVWVILMAIFAYLARPSHDFFLLPMREAK